MEACSCFTTSCVVLLLLAVQLTTCTTAIPCHQQRFPGGDTFVCVCNSTYCDTVEDYEPMQSGHFTVYTSSNTTGDRLTKRVYPISTTSNSTGSTVTIKIDKATRYQSVIGFGGCTTDAATINAFSLSNSSRHNLMKSYFSQDGIEYTLSRVPIGCTDLSTHYYSYDDHPGDFNLDNFSLATEDFKYKIPFIQEAMSVSRRGIKLFGSPWTPPIWMKTNNNYKGPGQIFGNPGEKYYKTWANYFIRFFEEYRKHNVTFWGVTVENEPMAGGINNYKTPSCYFTPEMERDFIKLDLGPALHANGFGDLELMMLDEQRYELPGWPEVVLTDADARSYVSGIGIHWYWDKETPLLKLDLTHMYFPDFFMLYTEACNGRPATLGLWAEGESYSQSIMENMNHWVSGWTDWDMALNLEGGPSFTGNLLNAPIIVDAEKDVFYKQPMFYHLGHFSKFIVPDSHRIPHTVDSDTKLLSIAFQLPDQHTYAIVLLNKEDQAVDVTISDPDVGYINARIPAESIQTYLWTDK
ncbi:lysosomal acid glucosylceramidase [Strongylocentrotus purpuratus]|uniref:Glucosylceramidase n=1 Tax=Strongylocentrotus purpuratus TaxID=7668 RepID=A0A7M7RFP7_STRPU|nr:lysosomal acid glucosylceramidase [Strongylocentrotus purpuratus]|eukprot:XP_799203.3 PREDICTED: glucosylceramidase [Strongylocentrotus purpuratus]